MKFRKQLLKKIHQFCQLVARNGEKICQLVENTLNSSISNGSIHGTHQWIIEKKIHQLVTEKSHKICLSIEGKYGKIHHLFVDFKK